MSHVHVSSVAGPLCFEIFGISLAFGMYNDTLKYAALFFKMAYLVVSEGVTAYVGRTNLRSVSSVLSHSLPQNKRTPRKPYLSLLYTFVSAPNNSFSIACVARCRLTRSLSSSACSKGIRWMRDHIFSRASSLYTSLRQHTPFTRSTQIVRVLTSAPLSLAQPSRSHMS